MGHNFKESAAMPQSGKNAGSIKVHVHTNMKAVKDSSALGHHNKLLNVEEHTFKPCHSSKMIFAQTSKKQW